jgi:IS1 family transposase
MCRQCGKTFTETKRTAYYRLRTSAETVTLVVTLIAHGCPLQAIVAAFGFDERTVADWLARAGLQSQAVHEHVVQTPRDLGQVQADEIRVKKQGGVVWMALAIMVSTRLWLAAEVSEHRDLPLIRRLIERVRACALQRALLFCTDGLCAYSRAIRETFRDAVRTGERGRPRLRAWKSILITQVVKRYEKRRVVGVERRIVQGSAARVEKVRSRSQGDGVINTAYIERLNATFRERLSSLTRRGRALARQTCTLRYGMYLIGTVYNFCTPHESLRLAKTAVGGVCVERTPAMAAGITDHCWSVRELLSFHVPPPRWTPPKQRGRPSRELQYLIERWCS